jgi:hypothetical protein
MERCYVWTQATLLETRHNMGHPKLDGRDTHESCNMLETFNASMNSVGTLELQVLVSHVN